MSQVDKLSKMVADWKCANCGEVREGGCPGEVKNWSYWDMVVRGNPVCPICTDDMVCILTSAKVEV